MIDISNKMHHKPIWGYSGKFTGNKLVVYFLKRAIPGLFLFICVFSTNKQYTFYKQ